MVHGKIYHYELQNTIENSYKPENIHLCWQDDTYGMYFVRADNNKKLEKTTNKGLTTSTVETRTNKNIARGWYDRDNHIIYLVDCEYDDTSSYVWKIDLSDDSITEIESVPADVFDCWLFNGELYISYFSTSYSLESEIIVPDDDITTEWTPTPAGTHWSTVDENPDTPDSADYIHGYGTPWNETDTFTNTTIALGGYDSGEIYEIEVKIYYYKLSSGKIEISGNKTGTTTPISISAPADWTWRSAVFSDLSLVQADLDDFEISFQVFGSVAPKIACVYTIIRFYGNITTELVIKNLDTLVTQSNNMGAIGVRTWEMSQMTIVGTDFHFNWKWSDENVEHWRFQTGDNSFDKLVDCGANTDMAPVKQWAIAYDGSSVLYFVVKDTSDSKYYLHTWDGTTLTKKGEYNIALMLDRNSDSSGTAPFNSERGFHLTDYYVYQILRNRGGIWKISDLNHADTPPTDVIIAITDKYLITNDAKLYEYKNFM